MAGTVRKRGNSWQALLSYSDPDTHRSIQFSATRATKKEAESALADLITRRDARKLIRGKVTFAQLADRWLTHTEELADRSPSTLVRYRDLLKPSGRIMTALGPIKVTNLTTYHVDRMMAANAGMSPNTRIAELNLVGAILNRGIKWGMLAGPNPTVGADRPKRPPTTISLPDADSYARLLTAADNDSLSMGTVVRLAAATGMRHGELAALQWEDVDWDARTLAVARTVRSALPSKSAGSVGVVKNGEPRVFALGDGVMMRLVEWRAEQARVWRELHDGAEPAAAIPMFAIGPLSTSRGVYQRIAEGWRRIRAAAGLPTMRLHDLRHYNATMLLEAGVPVTVIAERLGHDPKVTLATYGQVTAAADRRAAGVLDG